MPKSAKEISSSSPCSSSNGEGVRLRRSGRSKKRPVQQDHPYSTRPRRRTNNSNMFMDGIMTQEGMRDAWNNCVPNTLSESTASVSDQSPEKKRRTRNSLVASTSQGLQGSEVSNNSSSTSHATDGTTTELDSEESSELGSSNGNGSLFQKICRKFRRSKFDLQMDDESRTSIFDIENNHRELKEMCDSRTPSRRLIDDILFDFDFDSNVRPKPSLQTQGPQHVWPKLCYQSDSFLHYLSNRSTGRVSHKNKQVMEDNFIVSPLSDLEVMAEDDPFRTRVTTIDWHPKRTNHITIGSKHGDIVFYRVNNNGGSLTLEKMNTLHGLGPGGSVSALKYDPLRDENFYTAALDGKVCLRSAETGAVVKILLNTFTFDNWFCSLDVHSTENFVISGRSTGWVYLQSKQGEMVLEKRLHMNKVSHLEFSKSKPSLLCTASLDHTVRLWDMRMLAEKKPLDVLFFNRGVNSAYFSLTDGCRLLVTDQGSELRVYKGPMWHCEQTIRHPHRFFQHITPIKAYWHPIKDLVMCGRFPDCGSFHTLGKFRAIDVMDAATGKYVTEVRDVTQNKIASLNKMNSTGDLLLTCMSQSVQLWARPSQQDDPSTLTPKCPVDTMEHREPKKSVFQKIKETFTRKDKKKKPMEKRKRDC